MKKALRKDFLMEVRKSKARFLSIFFIVALGVAFFSGIQSASPDMRSSGDAYYDEKKLMDLKVIGTLGLTAEDVDALSALDGVEYAEGGWFEDVLSGEGENLKVLHIESLSSEFNLPVVFQGRLPEKSGEIFLDSSYAGGSHVSVGDRFHVQEDGDDGLLEQTEFDVVGVGQSPLYISFNRGNTTLGSGEINGFAYVLPEDFDQEVFTQIYLKVHGAEQVISYTDAYEDLVDRLKEKAEGIEEERCSYRLASIKKDAEEELLDGIRELYDGKRDAKEELADARDQIREGEEEYLDGLKEFWDGERQLEAGRKQLAYGFEQLEDGLKKFEDGKKELEDAKETLASGYDKLRSSQSEVDHGWLELQRAQDKLDSGKKELEDGKLQFENGKTELENGKAQLEAGKTALEEGKKAWLAGKEELENGKAQLEAGRTELEDGWKQYTDGKAALETARTELEQGKAELTAAETLLKEKQAELIAAEAELTAGKTQLEAGKAQLSAARTELETGKAQLEAGLQQVADGEIQTAAGKIEAETAAAALEEQKNQLQAGYAAGLIEEEAYQTQAAVLAAAEAELAAKRAELTAAEAALAAQRAELEGRQPELEAGLTEIELQEAALAGKEQELAQAEALVEAGKTELSAGFQELEAGKAKMEAGEAEIEANEKLLEETETKLKAGETELEASAKLIEESEAVLNASELEIQENETKILESEKTILAGEAELLEAEKTIRDSEKQILDGQKEIDENRAKLQDAQQQIDSGVVELLDGEKEIAEGEKELQDAADEIRKNEDLLKDSEKTLLESEEKLEDARADLRDGWRKLAEGQREFAEGKAEAYRELSEAEEEVADGKKKIHDLSMPEWFITGRNDLPEYSDYGDNADRIRNLGKVFPVIFFLVAALISLTTMTRMVEDQRTQIGTMKALGYGMGAIASKYILYALLATLGGSIFGVLIGEKIIPWVIITAYGIMYHNVSDHLAIAYELKFALMASAAALFCTVGATIFSCYREMVETPASLMRPPAPKEGKRILLEHIPFIWKRLNFTWKSSMRNLFRYKKRLFMTIFGIAGSMGLMLIGFGLHDSIMDVALIQYDQIQHYDGTIIQDSDAEPEELRELAEFLDQNPHIERWTNIQMSKMTATNGHRNLSTYVFVPEDLEHFREDVTLKNRTTGERYELTEDGAVICEKTASLLGIELGDQITLQRDNRNYQIPVNVITENYMGHYVYLTPSMYETVFGEKPNFESAVFTVKEEYGEQIEEVGMEILTCDAALSISYTASLAGQINRMLTTLNMVVVVLIVSAGMLAFVVLYNLNNINITERQRELATLKVLGFFDGEVSSYVFRENIILTMVGILGGAFFGIALHRYTITTVEVDAVMFGRNIKWPSFVYCALITAAFSLVVNLFMHGKLKKINMVESLKSVE